MKGTAAFIAYRSISDGLGKAAFFAITILAARWLTAADFGLVALGSTIGWMLAVASDAGIGVHLGRSVAQRPEQRGSLLGQWLPVRVQIQAVLLALLILILAVLPISSTTRIVIVLFALVYAASGALESLSGFFRGLSRSDIESTLVLIQRPAQLVLAVAALAWRPTPITLAAALLVPAVATLAAGAFMARRLANAERRTENAERPSSSTWFVFRRDVFPIGVGALLSALYFRLDILLIEWWQSTESVGLYNAVFRLVEALRLFPAAVLAVALPTLARASTAAPLVRFSSLVTGTAILATAVLLLLAEPIVIATYGAAFADAVPAFRVLLLAFPLMSVNYALTTQLIAWNGHRAYALLCAGALVFNVIINVRLIPTLSILGAAWATLATELVLTLGCATALSLRAGHLRTAPSTALSES